ncbi:hypothetical protein MSAN_01238700 [Mycena sanguinolenta]|uniref:Uncharacterized protein n=1 Tax=Mycena sanguinolenta TaxID=230812 RepID=A0A8H6YH28_9AGAR|nr:hypothetical protein MSAN_01238700 [Mycena sanguinolenta]
MLTKLRRVFKSHPSAGPNLRSNAETLAASSPVHRTEPAAAAKDAENIQTPSSHWKNGLVDNAAFALDVVEKLAAFAQTVPFVAPVAGFLSQIVKVYNEVQDTHDKRNILLDRITNIAEDLGTWRNIRDY